MWNLLHYFLWTMVYTYNEIYDIFKYSINHNLKNWVNKKKPNVLNGDMNKTMCMLHMRKIFISHFNNYPCHCKKNSIIQFFCKWWFLIDYKIIYW